MSKVKLTRRQRLAHEASDRDAATLRSLWIRRQWPYPLMQDPRASSSNCYAMLITSEIILGFSVGITQDQIQKRKFLATHIKNAVLDWHKVPVLHKPYSQMLADISTGRRIHDQRTFGPYLNPDRYVCHTPMCTGAHLINMVGKVGYKFLDKYLDHNIVAFWIHMKSRPDVPAPNFGEIAQHKAMAYIEERAAEEEAM